MTKLLSIALLFSFVLTVQVKAEEMTLKVGVVPQFNPGRIAAIWKPILAMLEAETGYKFTLSLAKDIPTFEKDLYEGKYHLAYMNPYHMLMANKKAGYAPLIKDSVKKLSGIIVVRKESSIQTVSELDGQTIAYPSPNALGATLLPRALFKRQYHINPRPSFVQSHDSVYLNVATGLAVAGGGVLKTFNALPDDIKGRLRVLFKTPSVASHPIAIHPALNKVTKDNITNALLKMGESKSGALLLSRVPIKKVGKANLSDYLPLHDFALEEFAVEG
ncbi:MAG: phosphate/phosphite/phosphonate ABC transporter substrate-binding protein [Methylocystaceae bacterium]|nr:phosphate/phosphite/phosphonate ABC transporter substrate-binding protein [Methylocystaceae bacterium]